MAALLEVASFRDAKGHIAHVRFFVSAGGTAITQQTAAGNVLTPMAAVSNATLSAFHGPDNSSPTNVVYGNTAQFQNAEDKMLLVFQSAIGVFHRFQIPAPKAASFLTDLETVDITNVPVLALVTAITVNATDQNGAALSTYIGGVRIRRKIQRKLNITILGPGDVIETPAE